MGQLFIKMHLPIIKILQILILLEFDDIFNLINYTEDHLLLIQLLILIIFY